MGFTVSEFNMLKKAAKKAGADTSGSDWKVKKKGSMFKNWDNPTKWKGDAGNVARGASAVASLGATEYGGKVVGGVIGEDLDLGEKIADTVNDPAGAWAEISGKKAAEDAAQATAEMNAKKKKLADEAQKGTLGAVEQGRQDIGTGTEQAVGALGTGQKTGLDALYGGSEQAAGALSASPNRMADLYGGGLGAGFDGDPGYQFRLKKGEDAITHAASAAGGRHGGDTLKALAEYNQNFASNEFNNYAQRQMGMAGAADSSDFARQSGLANLYSGTGQMASGINTGTGSQLAGLYSGEGSGLAGLGMQGAGINAGLTQSTMAGMQAPPPPGPGMGQQLLGLGAMAAGTYFGGPVGGAVAKQAVGGMTGGGGMGSSGLSTQQQNAAMGTPYAPEGYYK